MNVVVTSYNPYDAFSLEKELFDVLGTFKDDQTLEENLERLDKEHDIQLSPELIQYLFLHGVLTAPELKKAEPTTPALKPPSPVITTRKQRRDQKKQYSVKK